MDSFLEFVLFAGKEIVSNWELYLFVFAVGIALTKRRSKIVLWTDKAILFFFKVISNWIEGRELKRYGEVIAVFVEPGHFWGNTFTRYESGWICINGKMYPPEKKEKAEIEIKKIWVKMINEGQIKKERQRKTNL